MARPAQTRVTRQPADRNSPKAKPDASKAPGDSGCRVRIVTKQDGGPDDILERLFCQCLSCRPEGVDDVTGPTRPISLRKASQHVQFDQKRRFLLLALPSFVYCFQTLVGPRPRVPNLA